MTIIGFVLIVGMFAPVHGYIETTQFDLDMSGMHFYEPNLNRPHLVLKPGDSQQITLTITNNDSKQHLINLQMSADDSFHKDRIFDFKPPQLKISPNETRTSILTVSASPDANTGTTIWHTLIAKSNTFGAKALGFYVEVSEQPSRPSPDPVRRGSPGGMFPLETHFDIDEDDAINQVPYNILSPKVPKEYIFQGMYGLEYPEQIIYSKNPVSADTTELEFWDDGGLLISFFENKHFTFDERLGFLDSNQQQIRLNGWNGTASESLLLISSNDQKIFSNSRAIVFLDDTQIRIESQMPLDQILQIAESMIVEKTDVKMKNMDGCPVIHFIGYAWEDCGSVFTWGILGIPLLVIIVVPVIITLISIIWRYRK
ncbi:hypothetical protein NSED_03845 [Candidatus Nitrosopumilus sediminis]|uniref:VWA7 Ig-like domain-containing protein n=1 Tax=Candidatus Nitrosopumilus sediminis TaxID=1229909 RepID=K0BC33_9ARCH|nr:hypothetical protein NSED_03845 [Candidatus Nitrosopumilus sediminis]